MIGKVVEKDGVKVVCELEKIEKKDIFYYAKFYGIPVYFQPEENEIVGRNWFYDFLLDLLLKLFGTFLFSENVFNIKIEHKVITRQEIECC